MRPDSLAREANRARNGEAATWWRGARWRTSRRALWRLLERHIPWGSRVAVVGAGNGHDLPLRALRRRAGTLDLVDLDSSALRRARPRGARLIEQDITAGHADAIVARALGQPVEAPAPIVPLTGDYDVVVGDLFYTQLLYPCLADARLAVGVVEHALRRHGQPLTDAVVAALHASAPLVIHVHDVLGWWDGHQQPFAISDVLRLAEDEPQAALELALRGRMPLGCDPRAGSVRAGAEVVETAFWEWPFQPGVDYLVCATVAKSP